MPHTKFVPETDAFACISDKNKDMERKQYYAAIIQKLGRELGRRLYIL
jgi:hypothetical protein